MSGSFGRAVVALVSGATFGIGLTLSGMVDPARVRGFLDVFGSWNPALVFVLGGAVIVAAIGVAATRRMEHPMLDDAFHVPTATAIDARLLLGSAIFGIGWGIAGFCPGPALAALSYGTWPVAAFVTAMAIGMIAHDHVVPPARD